MDQSRYLQPTGERHASHYQRREESWCEATAVLGGAGSLEIKQGVQSVDLPRFPTEYKQGALATREALNMLQKEPGLNGRSSPRRPTCFPANAQASSVLARISC